MQGICCTLVEKLEDFSQHVLTRGNHDVVVLPFLEIKDVVQNNPQANHETGFARCNPQNHKQQSEVKRRLAVVEDNGDTRLLLHAILEDHYDIALYATGFEALEGLKNDPPELILLDISLPGMDGIEVLKYLRADARLSPLPVIALTAHAMTGDREKYISAGFNDYVTKPIIDEETLLRAIRKWLGVP